MSRLPLRKYRVDQYLNTIKPYFDNISSSDSLQRRINELKNLRSTLLTQENNFYQKYGVKNIDELNARVEKLQGLIRLGGSDLSKTLEKLIVPQESSAQELILQQIINSNEFQSYVIQNIKDSDFIEENLSPNAIHLLAEHLAKVKSSQGIEFRINSKNSKKKNFGLEKLLSNISKKNGQWIINKISKEKRVSSEFAKKVKNAFNKPQINSNGDQEVQSNIYIDLTQQNRQNYAGWQYKWEDVKDNPVLITNIRNSILTVCKNIIQGTAEENAAFERAFNNFPTEGLLQSTVQGVQGAIGEITLSAALDIITNGQSIGMQTGNVRNALQKNQQISVDFLLNEAGFQVKNYNEFAYQIPNTIILSRARKLDYWTEALDLNSTLTELLNLFYGIRWFNQKYHEDYQDTWQNILNMEEQLNSFYAQFPDKILRLSEEIVGVNSFGTEVLSGRFYNTFFFISGKKFVPSSTILFKIINFFEDMKGISHSAFDLDVTGSSSYSGTVTAQSYNKKEKGGSGYDYGNNGPEVSEITKNINVKLDVRFYLNDIFSDLY